MHRKTLFATLFLIGLLLTTSSCRKAETQVIKAEGVLPDMVLEKATYVFGRPDNSPLIISADRITVYNSSSEVSFEGLSFSQEDGKLSGTCDSGKSFDEKRIYLTGSVEILNSEKDVRISASEVIWDDTDKSITSDGVVSVVFEGKNTITAEGFSANINENIYEFERITEGRFDSE